MELFNEYAFSLIYVLLGVAILIVAKIVKDVLTPYKIDEQLISRDNPALGVTVAGYFAGVIAVFLGAVVGPDPEVELTTGELLAEIGIDCLYALGGIVALNLGRWVVDVLVLNQFSTVKEIVQDKNVGTGAVEGGCYVATGLIVAGAIHGEGGGPLSALVFFVLGQLVLVLFAKFYQFITRYDIHKEIEQNNVAAGVALGCSMIAIGVIVLKASAGDFSEWTVNLSDFGISAAIGFVVLMVLRKVTDFFLLPGTTIHEEIARDKSLNAAWIEGVVAMGMATIIFFVT